MMKAKIAIGFSCLVICSSVYAEGRKDTVSIGFLSTNSNKLQRFSEEKSQRFGNEAKFFSAALDKDAVISGGGAGTPKGAYISYRHEYSHTWGVITQLGYATSDGTQTYSAEKLIPGSTTAKGSGRMNVKGDFYYAGVGPTYRVNDFFSLYALISANYKSVSYDSYHIRVFDAQSPGYSIVKSESDDKIDIGYGLGVQLNVYDGFVIDASYGRSGGGEWNTKSIAIGVGYNF